MICGERGGGGAADQVTYPSVVSLLSEGYRRFLCLDSQLSSGERSRLPKMRQGCAVRDCVLPVLHDVSIDCPLLSATSTLTCV